MRVIAPVVVSGLALIVGAACSARLAGAQSPRITPKGDPSIRNDSIYSLVVRPRDYPGQPFVYLFEDGVVQFEEDGRAKRTYRLVIQILNQQAAEQWGEKTFSYTTGRQRLTVNWIRVLHLNGQVISDKPAHVQESDVPAEMGDPVYADTKVVRVSLTGVEPGAIIDYSATTEELKPFLPNDFYAHWAINTGSTVMRSRTASVWKSSRSTATRWAIRPRRLRYQLGTSATPHTISLLPASISSL